MSNRRAPYSLLSLTVLTCAGCSQADNSLDHYTLSKAIVVGAISDPSGRPVAGATVSVFAEAQPANCTETFIGGADFASELSDASGKFQVPSHIGPLGNVPACLSIRVKPPFTASLADTVVQGFQVVMKADVPGAHFDTVHVNIRLRGTL